MNKRKIIIIIAGIALFALILVAITLLESLKNSPETNTPLPTPTPIQNPTYDTSAAQKMLELLKEKPTPSATDAQIRDSITNTLTNGVSTVFETALVRVDYVKGPNDFEGEILTADIESAKQQAIGFFRGKGMTNDGICKLPLVFFPSVLIRQEIAQSNMSFSPLPDFCL